ncbi:MAG: nucleotide exchange factor GrpE [Flavobacteriales bacterium]
MNHDDINPEQPISETNPLTSENMSEKTAEANSSPADDQPLAEGQETASEVDKLQAEVRDLKDKYIRLMADLENLRKRNRQDLLETRNRVLEEVMLELLPVLDDLDLAIQNADSVTDIEAIREGQKLMHKKLFHNLERKGLKAMTTVGEVFNTDAHEAISQMPATSEEQKGKVIIEAAKGYMLGERVIRYAKVVTAN